MGQLMAKASPRSPVPGSSPGYSSGQAASPPRVKPTTRGPSHRRRDASTRLQGTSAGRRQRASRAAGSSTRAASIRVATTSAQADAPRTATPKGAPRPPEDRAAPQHHSPEEPRQHDVVRAAAPGRVDRVEGDEQPREAPSGSRARPRLHQPGDPRRPPQWPPTVAISATGTPGWWEHPPQRPPQPLHGGADRPAPVHRTLAHEDVENSASWPS